MAMLLASACAGGHSGVAAPTGTASTDGDALEARQLGRRSAGRRRDAGVPTGARRREQHRHAECDTTMHSA